MDLCHGGTRKQPSSNRTKETLLLIVERHVAKGATIYSDGWSAYCKLNEAGDDHFTVLHKYSFKKIYEVHTNWIECAWKHAKDHFRKLSGTKITQFKGHQSEVILRSTEKGEMCSSPSLIFCRHCTHCLDQQRAIRIQHHYSTLGRVSQQEVLNLMNGKFVQVLFI